MARHSSVTLRRAKIGDRSRFTVNSMSTGGNEAGFLARAKSTRSDPEPRTGYDTEQGDHGLSQSAVGITVSNEGGAAFGGMIKLFLDHARRRLSRAAQGVEENRKSHLRTACPGTKKEEEGPSTLRTFVGTRIPEHVTPLKLAPSPELGQRPRDLLRYSWEFKTYLGKKCNRGPSYTKKTDREPFAMSWLRAYL